MELSECEYAYGCQDMCGIHVNTVATLSNYIHNYNEYSHVVINNEPTRCRITPGFTVADDAIKYVYLKFITTCFEQNLTKLIVYYDTLCFKGIGHMFWMHVCTVTYVAYI